MEQVRVYRCRKKNTTVIKNTGVSFSAVVSVFMDKDKALESLEISDALPSTSH